MCLLWICHFNNKLQRPWRGIYLIKTGSGGRREATREGPCNVTHATSPASQRLFPAVGRDVATSVEVYWPDGRSMARLLEPSDLNSVLEIHYPRDAEVTPTAQIEVRGRALWNFLARSERKKKKKSRTMLGRGVPVRHRRPLRPFDCSPSELSPTLSTII